MQFRILRCQVIPRCREHGDTVAKDAGAYHQQSSGYAKRNHRRPLSRLRLFGFNSGRGLARLDERCAAQLLPRLGRKAFTVTRLSLRDELPTLRAGVPSFFRYGRYGLFLQDAPCKAIEHIPPKQGWHGPHGVPVVCKELPHGPYGNRVHSAEYSQVSDTERFLSEQSQKHRPCPVCCSGHKGADGKFNPDHRAIPLFQIFICFGAKRVRGFDMLNGKGR